MLKAQQVQAGSRRFLSVLASAVLLATASAHAQTTVDCPEQDPVICGRRHFETGTAAFERGDYPAATSAFEAALAQRPHAVIRFNLGLSLARSGRPKAAIEQLALVEADAEADKELRGRAERERRSAQQSLARVSFRLTDPSHESVELDGAAIEVRVDEELSLDPGNHRVRVISGSSVVLDQELELAPGERVELRVGERSRRIDVVVVPAAAPPPPPIPPPLTAAPPASGVSPAWLYAGAGATLVVTGLTVWSGIDTKHALDDYERDLPNLSPAEADERLQQGHALELRTNLLLAGSIALGVGTAVLGIWFVDFGDKQVSVGVAPNRMALRTRF
ncbi:MAG TPA: tetratricopeptide repeat protein [Polyangiaceae bacterium]